MKAIPLTCSSFGWKTLRSMALPLMAAVTFALSGCSLLYQPEVLQGNFISKEQAQTLQIGQSRKQVQQILGTPLITDMFRNDRWDYVFTMLHRRDVKPQKFMLSVFFVGDSLARIEGADTLPADQDFIDLIGSRKTYKPRDLQANPEQLDRFTENNKPPKQQELPTAPATTSYPSLPQ